MKSILFMLATLFLGLTVSAQYKIGILPRTSPDKGIYEQIGYTGVEILYLSYRMSQMLGQSSSTPNTINGVLITIINIKISFEWK